MWLTNVFFIKHISLKYIVGPKSNSDASFKFSFSRYIVSHVSWLPCTLAPPEMIASLLLAFLFWCIFFMYLSFLITFWSFGLFTFPLCGHWVLGNLFCCPSWFCNSTFWFSRQLQICTFITPFTECWHCFWFSVALYCLSSIPQGLCITFRSLFSAPCFQIKSSFLS